MSWQDNLREAAYISPLGFRTVFLYEDVSKTLDKKTSNHEFPFFNGTFVQDLGHTGRKFPLRMFFSGDTYDKVVLDFEATLNERGIGRLEHPIYGTVNVIPFGSISRRDDLKTAANQAVIEVTFWESITEIYAGSITDIADLIVESLALFTAAASGQLSAEVFIESVSESVAFKKFFATQVGSTAVSFSTIVKASNSVNNAFSQTKQSMLTQLESVEQPNVSVLASQATLLAQLPGRVVESSIDDRLVAYKSILVTIISDDTIMPASYNKRIENEFFSRDVFAASYITGMITAVLSTTFTAKPDALSAAEAILLVFDAYVIWRDANYTRLELDDTGDMYAELLTTVLLTVGFLVQLSFSLSTEKRIVLVRPRSMIELVAELYGEVDDKLDFFINSNDLSGSEILELPRGREIVYYV